MPGTLPERNAPVADSPISVLGPRPLPDHTIITGAAGWLGQGLCNLLTDLTSRYYRPTPITAIVRNSEEAALLTGIAGVTTMIGDVTDSSAMLDAFADADAGPTTDLIHTAGVIHPARLADFEAINAGGTRNVVEAAATAGVRRMVHVSSNSPFGLNPDRNDTFRHEEPYRPYLGYGVSKMRGEQAISDACRAGMLDAVMVRPPWFYGPWQPLRQTTFFKMVGSGKFPMFGGGRQRRSMVYIENLVQGIVRAELSDAAPGSAWWVADAQPYTVAEIVSTVQAAPTRRGPPVEGRRHQGAPVRRRRCRGRRQAAPAVRSLQAGDPRARRDGGDHRLRHLRHPHRVGLRPRDRPARRHAPIHSLVPVPRHRPRMTSS